MKEVPDLVVIMLTPLIVHDRDDREADQPSGKVCLGRKRISWLRIGPKQTKFGVPHFSVVVSLQNVKKK